MILSSYEMAAIGLSLKVAAISMMVIIPLGLAIAYGLSRHNFKGKALIETIINLPLVLPPVVIGYLLLMAFNRQAPLGQFLEDVFGLSFAFNWLGAALASTIIALPLFIRSAKAGFDMVNPHLAKSAQTLGASNVRIFTRIYLPLSLPAIMAGGILAFARAIGEFGATITFVSNIPSLTQTLPLALYQAAQAPNMEEQAFRLMVISIVLSFGVIYISQIWLNKSSQKDLSGQRL